MQVNQLVQVAQKCQSTINDSGADGVSQQDLQTSSNMVLAAGRHLAKSLDLQSLNELGFSKRYVRCPQISEVVNSTKDLVDFCQENKTGPVEGLKSYNQHVAATRFPLQKMQEIEELTNVQGLPIDRNTLNKLMALHPCLNNQISSSQPAASRRAQSGSVQAAFGLTNIQSMFMRQNSMNSSHNSLQQDASSFTHSSPIPSSSVQGDATLVPGSLQRLPSNTYSGSRQPVAIQRHHMQQQHPLGSSSSVIPPGNAQQSQGDNNQTLQHLMMQQFLQEFSNASGGMMQQQQQPLVGHSLNRNAARNNVGFGLNVAPPQVAPCTVGRAASRSNSFKAASNGANGGTDVFIPRAPEMSRGDHNHIQDDVVGDIDQEFVDDSFFDGDLGGTMGFSWKHD